MAEPLLPRMYKTINSNPSTTTQKMVRYKLGMVAYICPSVCLVGASYSLLLRQDPAEEMNYKASPFWLRNKPSNYSLLLLCSFFLLNGSFPGLKAHLCSEEHPLLCASSGDYSFLLWCPIL